MSTIARLLIELGVDATDLEKIDSRLEEWDKKFKKVGDKMTGVGKTMTMGVTAPIVAGFGLALKAGAEEQQQMDLLANTIRTNVAGATDEMLAANEDWIASMQDATAIADGEMRDAMMFLVASGMDLEKAQKAITVAMDAAAVTGKDLGTITEAMGKAYNGNVGALGRYGIATKDAEGKTLSFDQIMGNLNETMGGAAVAAADSAAGRAENLKLKMGDLTENIGMMLLPVLDKLVGWLSKIVDWFSNLDPGMQQTIVTLAAVAAAVGPVLIVAGKLVSAFGAIGKAFQVLSAVLSANPYVAIIAATVALVTLIVANWDKIKAAAKATVDWIKGRWDAMVDFFRGLPSRVGGALSSMWDGIKTGFKNALNWLIDKWNKFHIPAVKIAGVQVTPRVDFPDIPKLHSGGVFRAPGGAREGLALLETGERVIPTGMEPRDGGVTFIFHGDVYGDEGFMRKVREANVNISRLGWA